MKITTPEIDRLKIKPTDGMTLVRCWIEPESGTLCKVDGKETINGLVEDIKKIKEFLKKNVKSLLSKYVS